MSGTKMISNAKSEFKEILDRLTLRVKKPAKDSKLKQAHKYSNNWVQKLREKVSQEKTNFPDLPYGGDKAAYYIEESTEKVIKVYTYNNQSSVSINKSTLKFWVNPDTGQRQYKLSCRRKQITNNLHNTQSELIDRQSTYKSKDFQVRTIKSTKSLYAGHSYYNNSKVSEDVRNHIPCKYNMERRSRPSRKDAAPIADSYYPFKDDSNCAPCCAGSNPKLKLDKSGIKIRGTFDVAENDLYLFQCAAANAAKSNEGLTNTDRNPDEARWVCKCDPVSPQRSQGTQANVRQTLKSQPVQCEGNCMLDVIQQQQQKYDEVKPNSVKVCESPLVIVSVYPSYPDKFKKCSLDLPNIDKMAPIGEKGTSKNKPSSENAATSKKKTNLSPPQKKKQSPNMSARPTPTKTSKANLKSPTRSTTSKEDKSKSKKKGKTSNLQSKNTTVTKKTTTNCTKKVKSSTKLSSTNRDDHSKQQNNNGKECQEAIRQQEQCLNASGSDISWKSKQSSKGSLYNPYMFSKKDPCYRSFSLSNKESIAQMTANDPLKAFLAQRKLNLENQEPAFIYDEKTKTVVKADKRKSSNNDMKCGNAYTACAFRNASNVKSENYAYKEMKTDNARSSSPSRNASNRKSENYPYKEMKTDNTRNPSPSRNTSNIKNESYTYKEMKTENVQSSSHLRKTNNIKGENYAYKDMKTDTARTSSPLRTSSNSSPPPVSKAPYRTTSPQQESYRPQSFVTPTCAPQSTGPKTQYQVCSNNPMSVMNQPCPDRRMFTSQNQACPTQSNQYTPNKDFFYKKHCPKPQSSNIHINIKGKNENYDVSVRQGSGINDIMTSKQLKNNSQIVRRPCKPGCPGGCNSKQTQKSGSVTVDGQIPSQSSSSLNQAYEPNLSYESRNENMASPTNRDSRDSEIRRRGRPTSRDSATVSKRIKMKCSKRSSDLIWMDTIPGGRAHYRGDECINSDLLARDREIRMLLGVNSIRDTTISEKFKGAVAEFLHSSSMDCIYRNRNCYTINKSSSSNSAIRDYPMRRANIANILLKLNKDIYNENLMNRKFNNMKRPIGEAASSPVDAKLNYKGCVTYAASVTFDDQSGNSVTGTSLYKELVLNNVNIDSHTINCSTSKNLAITKNIEAVNSSDIDKTVQWNDNYDYNCVERPEMDILPDFEEPLFINELNEILVNELAMYQKATIHPLEMNSPNETLMQQLLFTTNNFLNTGLPNLDPVISLNDTVQFIYHGKPKSLTPNLGASALSLKTDSRNDIKQHYKGIPPKKNSKNMFKSLLSCFKNSTVQHSSCAYEKSRKQDVYSVNSYYISSVLGGMEMSSSVYDTSVSFCSNQSVQPSTAKPKCRFLRSLRGMIYNWTNYIP